MKVQVRSLGNFEQTGLCGPHGKFSGGDLPIAMQIYYLLGLGF